MPFILDRDGSPEEIPYIANLDTNNNPAVPTEQYIKVNGIYLPVSSSNPLPTQLTGSKISVVRYRQTPTMNVGVGQLSQTIIYADTGMLARLKAAGVYVPAPSGATSGTHNGIITIGTDIGYSDEKFWDSGAPAYNVDISLQVSNDSVPIEQAIFNSSTVPLVFTYSNNTNVTQTGKMLLYFLYEEEPVI